jgi:predicted nucleic acid-binding protein
MAHCRWCQKSRPPICISLHWARKTIRQACELKRRYFFMFWNVATLYTGKIALLI